jgi:hypothetical protein
MLSSTWKVDKRATHNNGFGSLCQESVTVTCIKFGKDQIALSLGVPTSSVLHTKLSTLSPGRLLLSHEVGKVVSMHWHPHLFHLLLVSDRTIFALDCTRNCELAFLEVPAQEGTVVNAFWIDNGFLYLTDRRVLSILTLQLKERSRQDLPFHGKLCSAAIDGRTLYVGSSGTVHVFDLGPDRATATHSFLAHSRDVERIQVRQNYIATWAEGGNVIWSKDDFVPLFAVKADGPITIDLQGDLAIGRVKGGGAVLLAVKPGKKGELRESLDIAIGKNCVCDWREGEDGVKTVTLVDEGGLFESLMFVQVSRK